MLIGLLIMALWLNDPGASYNQVYSSAPAYLGGGDAARWQRLRVLKMLYRGNHRGYFLDEQRTQFNYPYEEIEGRLVKRYLTYNLCKLISHTTADLMFGAKVKLDAPTAEQTARLDDLSRDSLLHARFHEAACRCPGRAARSWKRRSGTASRTSKCCRPMRSSPRAGRCRTGNSTLRPLRDRSAIDRRAETSRCC
jgi:hypothetical protein